MNYVRLTIFGEPFVLSKKGGKEMQEKADLFKMKSTIKELYKVSFDKESQKLLLKLFARFGLKADFNEDGTLDCVWTI